ncbi:hypothetical protein BVH06_03025 [Pseudomonas sp. PA27(2017)]|nr:hypothetical protein BVH06_03025 [Pseudomonas sp. PA27(2017)]
MHPESLAIILRNSIEGFTQLVADYSERSRLCLKLSASFALKLGKLSLQLSCNTVENVLGAVSRNVLSCYWWVIIHKDSR